ncbi:MAG: hypothetical protein JO337_08195 [Acidimicrobiales bacterium]|nr:hypothetical protein [Acidimicrobiales bacterium]
MRGPLRQAMSPAGSPHTGSPHTGSLTGELAAFRARKPSVRGTRGKKVYAITSRGEELFDELLAAETQSNDDERLFNLRLAFARYLPPDARIGMLERRRAHLVERLIQIRARVKAVRDGYAQSLIEHDREAAEHDLSWIDRLLASERAARVPQGSADPEPPAPIPSVTPQSGTSQSGVSSRGPERPVRSSAGAHSPTISGFRPTSYQEAHQQ